MASSTSFAVADSMRSALTVAALFAALFVSGCASSPITPSGGLALGKSGWEFSGGIDLEKRLYFLYFSRPFGAKERALADGWAK